MIFVNINYSFIRILLYGVLVSVLWRIINIRNLKINYINDEKELDLDDSDLSEKRNLTSIDYVLIFTESIIGSFFALFITYVVLVAGIADPNKTYINSYDFVMSFIAIPGYGMFIRLRVFLNDFISKALPKKLFDYGED